MFQIFNINLSNFYKKENSSKFTIIGICLIIIGIFSFLYKNVGITLVSYTFSALLLFLAYLNLKNINELKRYANKNDIMNLIYFQFILIPLAILLIIFPNKIQIFISSIFGVYIILSQLFKLLKNKMHSYYKSNLSIFKIIIGLILMFSPLFLSKFIASILSLILFLFGVCFYLVGKKLKK